MGEPDAKDLKIRQLQDALVELAHKSSPELFLQAQSSAHRYVRRHLDQIRKLEPEPEALAQELKAAQTDLQAALAQKLHLQNEHSELVARMSDTIASLRAELESLPRLRVELASCKSAVQTREARMQTIVRQRDDALDEDKLAAERAQLLAVTSARDALAQTTDLLQNQLSCAVQERDDGRSQLDTLKSRLADVQKERDDVKTRLDALDDATLTREKMDATTTRTALARTSNSARAKDAELHALRDERDAARAQVAAVTTERDAHAAEAATLREQLARAVARGAEVPKKRTADNAAVVQECALLTAERDIAVAARDAALVGQNAAAETHERSTALVVFSERNAARDAEIAALTRQCGEMHYHGSALQQTVAMLHAQCGALSAELGAMRRSRDDAHARLSDRDALLVRVFALEHERTTRLAQMQEPERECAALRDELIALRAELEDAASGLAERDEDLRTNEAQARVLLAKLAVQDKELSTLRAKIPVQADEAHPDATDSKMMKRVHGEVQKKKKQQLQASKSHLPVIFARGTQDLAARLKAMSLAKEPLAASRIANAGDLAARLRAVAAKLTSDEATKAQTVKSRSAEGTLAASSASPPPLLHILSSFYPPSTDRPPTPEGWSENTPLMKRPSDDAEGALRKRARLEIAS